MFLIIQSGTFYLSTVKTHSYDSGIYFLSNLKTNKTTSGEYTLIINGFIFLLWKILRNIIASTVEAEYGTSFLNGQVEVPNKITLAEMNHLQPPTPIQVDNATLDIVANKSIKQKVYKVMNMQFH